MLRLRNPVLFPYTLLYMRWVANQTNPMHVQYLLYESVFQHRTIIPCYMIKL